MPAGPPNPWELIVDDPDLSTFEDLIRDANLIDVFQRADRTVLAPDNDAFDAVDPADLPTGTELRDMLERHVVTSALTVDEIFDGTRATLPTVQGDDLTLDQTARTIGTTGAQIVAAAADQATANGSYVQVIDAVILEP